MGSICHRVEPIDLLTSALPSGQDLVSSPLTSQFASAVLRLWVPWQGVVPGPLGLALSHSHVSHGELRRFILVPVGTLMIHRPSLLWKLVHSSS